MNSSVCIATYNGSKFLKDQLKSVLCQLEIDDEVIIVDDFSEDNTIEIIKKLNDTRIRIFKNKKNCGHVYSFSKALELANNEFIFMCDQDDIWIKNRVQKMKSKIRASNSLLLSSNQNFINNSNQSILFDHYSISEAESKLYFLNIKKIFKGTAGYYGCAMCLKKELKKIILPIPSYVESHDLWIAIASNLMKSNHHLNDYTLKRRIHDKNASIIHRNLFLKLKSRLIFIITIIHLLIRIYKLKIFNKLS